MKTYDFAFPEVTEFLQEALNLEELSDLKMFNIRYGVLMVTKTDKLDMVVPAFSTLPYKVQICSPADVISKRYDVEIVIDSSYWELLTEDVEKLALMHSALYQLIIRVDKDGMPKMSDNGRIQLSKRKADIIVEGFSVMANTYNMASPDIKTLRRVRDEFSAVFNNVM